MKRRVIFGIAAISVVTVISALGVSAADNNYSFNTGKEKMEQSGYTSEEKGIDTSEYSYRKGADKVRESYVSENAEERLAAGEITQEEYDAIKAAAKEKHEKISARYSGLSEMSPTERHRHFAQLENDEDISAEL